MQQPYTWLITSIFCNKSHWNELLNEIETFLNDMSFEKYNGALLLEFNYLCGENIRFALLVPEENANNFAKQTDKYFKHFFLESHFSSIMPGLPIEGIFLPFPENTIQYGLYKPVEINGVEGVRSDLFRSSLSFIMIDALKMECIDNEILLTFVFYLRMALIKIAIEGGYSSPVEIYNFYFNDSNSLLGDTDKNLINSIVADNKEKLFEIAESIINPLKKDNIPCWLKKWMDVCKKEMGYKSELSPEKKMLLIHNHIVYLVYKQLGVNEKMETMLSSFLKQVFQTKILNGLSKNNALFD